MIDVVIALIEKEGKICIGQRMRDPFKGYFECPGGKVEKGESLLEGLKRELFEEGNAQLKNAAYITQYDVSNEFGNFRMHWFKVDLIDDFQAIIYKEILYVDVNDLFALKWIPHNIPYINMMKEAMLLKEETVILDTTPSVSELLALFKDEKHLIKKVHLNVDELCNEEIINLAKLYPIELSFGKTKPIF